MNRLFLSVALLLAPAGMAMAVVTHQVKVVTGAGSTWEIHYDCRLPGDSGPSDPGSGLCENTPAPAQGSNTAPTKGGQYLAVIEQAVEYYADRLASDVAIRAQINIGPMGCLGQTGTLLGSYETPYVVPMREDNPVRPLHMFGGPGISYTVAQAVAMMGPQGYDQVVNTWFGSNAVEYDLYRVTINNLSGCAGQEHLPFRGLEGDAIPQGSFSLYHTTLHELGHGLGMEGSSVLDVFTLDVVTGRTLFEMEKAGDFETVAAAVGTPNRLVWSGPAVAAEVADREITQGVINGRYKILSGEEQGLSHFARDHGTHEWMAISVPEPPRNRADGSLTIAVFRDIRWPMVGDSPIVILPAQTFDRFEIAGGTTIPFGPTFGNTAVVSQSVTVEAYNILDERMAAAPMRIACDQFQENGDSIQIASKNPGPFQSDGETPMNTDNALFRQTGSDGTTTLQFTRMTGLYALEPTEGDTFACVLHGRDDFQTTLTFVYTEAGLADRTLAELSLNDPFNDLDLNDGGGPVGVMVPDALLNQGFAVNFAPISTDGLPFADETFTTQCTGPSPDTVSIPGSTVFSGTGYQVTVPDQVDCMLLAHAGANDVHCAIVMLYDTTLPAQARSIEPVVCKVGLEDQNSPKLVVALHPKTPPVPATIEVDVSEVSVQESAVDVPVVVTVRVLDAQGDPIPAVAPILDCDLTAAAGFTVAVDNDQGVPITGLDGRAAAGFIYRTTSDFRSGEGVCTATVDGLSTNVRFVQTPAFCANGRQSCFFLNSFED